jgi:hypothetical protein
MKIMNNKKILLIILSISILAYIVFLNSKNNYVNSVEENLLAYDSCERSVDVKTTEGASLTTFYGTKGLVKMELVYYGEIGKVERSVYLKDGSVFSVIDFDYTYNKPIYMDGSEVKNVEKKSYKISQLPDSEIISNLVQEYLSTDCPD